MFAPLMLLTGAAAVSETRYAMRVRLSVANAQSGEHLLWKQIMSTLVVVL